MMLRHSELSGSGDRSGRSRIAWPAVPAPTAISWPPPPMLAMLAGVAAVTPGSPVIALGSSGPPAPASTRTSEPTANAAWSAADCCQLRHPASASVVVAVATTTSRTGPAWRIGRRPICQLTMAAASRLPRSVAPSASLGQQRQRTERHERDPGQRERGSDGDHRIDPE